MSSNYSHANGKCSIKLLLFDDVECLSVANLNIRFAPINFAQKDEFLLIVYIIINT